MPVPTETLYRMGRLNIVFAASAAFLLVTTIWFIAVDHGRQWRDHQTGYMTARAALAHLDYLRTLSAEEAAKLEAARHRLDSAKTLVHVYADRIEAEREKLAGWQRQLDDVGLRHGDADGLSQVTQQEFEKALAKYGSDDPHTVAKREQLTAELELASDLRRQKEELDDNKRTTEGRIKKLEEPLIDAQKEYDALMSVREGAKRKAHQYGNALRQAAFNIPLFDFATPYATAGRQSIKQLVLPDIRQNLNYLETYTTDRCITCHVAINDKEFSRRVLVRTFEEALPAINEELQRNGQEKLPPVPLPTLTGGGEDTPTLEAGQVARHWDLLTRDQRRNYFDALLEAVNTYLDAGGFKRIKLGQPLLAHPDLDLYVHVDSPHPMAKMGCTVCHEGNPQETDFVLAAHAPPDHETEERWAHDYYETALGVPTATFELIEHYWDRHMLPLKYTEGTCMKCHPDVTGIGEFGGEFRARVVQRGQDLFTRAGCANCHLIKGLEDYRRVGPDLAHIADKLEPGFTQQWIYNPKGFRPSTWMPHFFMQENNGPGSENDYDPNPTLRTQTEVAAMTHYLFSLSVEQKSEAIPKDMTGDAQRGRSLFLDVGCLGCHASLAEFGQEWIRRDMEESGKTEAQAKADYEAMSYDDRAKYAMENFGSDRDTMFDPDELRFDPDKDYNQPIFTRLGPELSTMGTKTSVAWLYAWLRDPSAYSSTTRMPRLRLTEQEALDIATYLADLKHDEPSVAEFPQTQAQRDMAEERVFEILADQRSGANSRSITNDEGGRLTRMLKVMLARSKTVADIAPQRIDAMDLQGKRMMFLGSKAISHYGCYACHNIPGFETAVRPGTELTTWAEKPISQLDFGFYDHGYDALREAEHNVDLFARLYPPHRPDLVDLARGANPHEQVTKTHAAFAYHKMRNPRIWDRKKIKKPFDKLKMPNYYFLEEEADALATFLMGRSSPRVNANLIVDYDDPRDAIAAGRHLVRDLNCVGCHQIENNVANVQQYYRVASAGETRFDEDNAPPYLRGEGAKVQHNWFYEFLYNVEMLRPWLKIRMPSFDLTTQEATTIVEYFAGLAQEESTRLARHLKPVAEYADSLTPARSTSEGESSAGEDPPPGHDWFTRPSLEASRDALGDYAIHNRLIRAFALDPDENSLEELAEGYQSVLAATSFLRGLYDVRYPFVDSPRPLVSQERFQLGEQFLLELGCLKCHVLGDPNVAGANKSPTAPNLNLTFRRLQQDWVRDWVKAPAVIQPGTKMPGLWLDDGAKSAFVDFGDVREELEAKYGATALEQIELVIDYLYNAGLLNHTAIDPVVAAAQQATPEGEEEEFFEEEEEFFEDDG